jgi:aspartyl-tRNA(Asn)/glutamyl-tRNA(Gln) amidotransferase subunit A
MRTLRQLADDLQSRTTTSRQLLDECLARIEAPNGEGSRVFLKVRVAESRTMADRIDRERTEGRTVSPFAGIPISVKDLFDIEGDVTTAGSTLLKTAAPAKSTAASVARLSAAGFIPVGRTNMTEFAFSGLGLNSHYGTPANPYDRANKRIPGGSSSGAAVSVTDQMAFAALGTDTGGSCRIPAAMCGIVGYKPTARRIPLDGAFPLSPSLDSIGPLANSVDCCAIVAAILAGEPVASLSPPALAGLRLAIPKSLVFDDIEAPVAAAFERAIRSISSVGARLDEIKLAELLDLPQLNRKGGLAPPEALAIHRDWLARQPEAYDPRVRARILRGEEQSAADYIQLLNARKRMIDSVTQALQGYDAMLLPTVPLVAPTIASLAHDAAYGRANMLALRNPSVVNFIDGCAISIPIHAYGDAPVGLMIAGRGGDDSKIMNIAAAIEQNLALG